MFMNAKTQNTIMKQLILLILIGIGMVSCSSTKKVPNEQDGNEIGVQLKVKTQNPNIPYIYKNGFNRMDVNPILSVKADDSTYVNELRFNAVYSAMYTKKVMYDHYGKWDREIWPKEAKHPTLIWENRKLLESQEKFFSVAAYGTESREELCASVMIFDSENRDCLTEESETKDALVDFFATGIRDLSTNERFFKVYWRTVNSH